MRTAAMLIVTAGCAAMAAGWAYFVIALLLPTGDSELASVLIPLSFTFVVDLRCSRSTLRVVARGPIARRVLARSRRSSASWRSS